MKEEFGDPQRLVYVLVVCARFSELILMNAYLQVLAKGGGRLIYHERYLQGFSEGLFKLAVVYLQQLVNRKL